MNIKLSVVVEAVLCVFLFSSHAQAEKSMQEELDEQIEECRHFDKISCEMVIPKLNAMKTPLAGELSVAICLNRDELCDNALSTGAPAVQKTLVEHIDQICMKTGADICSSLASHMVEKGQYAKAIAVAKIQFDKTKEGIYGLYEYKYGNREKGLKAAEVECLNDSEQCGFYLANLKPNRATPVFLKGTLEQCEGRKKYVAYGTDECVLAALYFYRNHDAKEAAHVLMTSCERGNQKACVYAIALQPRQAKALRVYCKVNDSGSRESATEGPDIFPGNENWLDCKGVNRETQTISQKNILQSLKDLKGLDNAFGDPI